MEQLSQEILINYIKTLSASLEFVLEEYRSHVLIEHTDKDLKTHTRVGEHIDKVDKINKVATILSIINGCPFRSGLLPAE